MVVEQTVVFHKNKNVLLESERIALIANTLMKSREHFYIPVFYSYVVLSVSDFLVHITVSVPSSRFDSGRDYMLLCRFFIEDPIR